MKGWRSLMGALLSFSLLLWCLGVSSSKDGECQASPRDPQQDHLMVQVRSYRRLVQEISRVADLNLEEQHSTGSNFNVGGDSVNAVYSGDYIYLTTYWNKHVCVEDNNFVQAIWDNYGEWERFKIVKVCGEGVINVGDAVFLIAWTGKTLTASYDGISADTEDRGEKQRFSIEKAGMESGEIMHNDTVFFRAWTGRHMDANGTNNILARYDDQGSWQSMKIELAEVILGPPVGPTTPAPFDYAVGSRSIALDAQFLIQATFGPTRAALLELQNMDSYEEWIQKQLQLPYQSHRAYYRSKVNPRTHPTLADAKYGRPRERCERGSRWLSFALSIADVGLVYNLTGGKLYVNGTLRTEIDLDYTNNGLIAPMNCSEVQPKPWWICNRYISNLRQNCDGSPDFIENTYCQQSCFDYGYGYEGNDCSVGWPNLTASDISGQVCHAMEEIQGNVKLSLDPNSCEDTFVMKNPKIWFSEASTAAPTTSLDFEVLRPGVVLLKKDTENCGFGKFLTSSVEGSSYIYHEDRRLLLVDNTPENMRIEHGDNEACRVVPRTHPDQSCKLVRGCETPTVINVPVALTVETFQTMLDADSKYVYAVTGLRLSLSPCERTARWKRLDCSVGDCEVSADVSESDLASVAAALVLEDSGETFLDIYTPCTSVPPGAVVKTGNVNGTETYFQHVHLQEMNVYDFTAWVEKHPGGPTKIQQWTEKGFILEFPDWHPMERWESDVGAEVVGSQYVGLFGSEVDYDSLPSGLQSTEIAIALGATTGVADWVENCGSPGEVANNPMEGHNAAFRISNLYQDPYFERPAYNISIRDPVHQGKSTWINRALYGEDQLRQRMAWALSQIWVVGMTGFGYERPQEMWLGYYDIFTRHAFGNYRDIMAEVTLSPMMGLYLSFTNNKAFDEGSKYPDENYAREIMQLFTIGLVKLNEDGSPVTNNGEEVSTYSNENIMHFSRVLTGFSRQSWRGNKEYDSSNTNLMDPMAMRKSWHDSHPKPDLDGGYLGDSYPLCEGVPEYSFLKKGAKWRFGGEFAGSEKALVLEKASPLYKALCGGSVTNCQTKIEWELEETLPCYGKECYADWSLTVQVGANYYEYETPPCVWLYFYNGMEAARGYSNYHYKRQSYCRNPKWPSGSMTCCSYDEEGSLQEDGRICATNLTTVRYSFNEHRCADEGKIICKAWPKTYSGCTYLSTYMWTPRTCSSDLVVHSDGQVSWTVDAKYAQNKVWVDWDEGSYPTISGGNCTDGCWIVGTTCRCADVVESRSIVFEAAPSLLEAKASLRIGAFEPNIDCTSNCDGEVQVYSENGAFDENTIFGFGGKFFKNIKSVVTVNGHAFRNPPQFMVKDMPTKRAALLEVDALLDHLFYHPNTATFVAYRLIQRFTTSNPSGDYVKAVGDAFRTGTYGGTTFSGKYGDLMATVAAVLLHSEARDWSTSTANGALREPLIKVLHWFRALEYKEREDREVGMRDLSAEIAQFPFESGSVFNFYLPAYSPDRFANSIVAPEFQILNTPTIVDFFNGLFQIIDSGFSSCNSGWGSGSRACLNGYFHLPTSNVSQTLDELDLLLTGSRFSQKEAVRPLLTQLGDEEAAVKYAKKAVLLAPEFHNMGEPAAVGARAVEEPQELPDPRNYKAMVLLYLAGGADTFNLLVPLECSLYDEYVEIREQVALLPEKLHKIATDGQSCESFGIHGELSYVKELYDLGEAAFFANVGALVEPMTYASIKDGSGEKCTGLFSHSDQTLAAFTLDCQNNRASKEYLQTFSEALEAAEVLGEQVNNANLDTKFATSSDLDRQFKQVAKLIASRHERKAERDIFFVRQGGWDTHGSLEKNLVENFNMMNNALKLFAEELKSQGVWNQTVVVTHSDFGRTLTPNSGAGTDHAWSGNHMILGGALHGGRVFNEYPDSLLTGSEQDIGRGRLYPRFPWESAMVPIAEWMGVDEGDLSNIFPNYYNFNRTKHFIPKESLFAF